MTMRDTGFAKVPNALRIKLARTRLRPTESMIVWTIFNETFGWNRETAEVSAGKLATEIGVDRADAAAALRNLSERRIINREVFPGRTARVSLNLATEEWDSRSTPTPQVWGESPTVEVWGESPTVGNPPHSGVGNIPHSTPAGNGEISPQFVVSSPTGPSAPGTPKDNVPGPLHHVRPKDNVRTPSESSAPPASGGLFGDLPEVKSKARKETPIQVYIRELWVATGHEGCPNGKSYPRLVQIVEDTPEDILDDLLAYIRVKHLTFSSKGTDDSGAFKTWFTRMTTRDFTWRQRASPPQGDGKRRTDFDTMRRNADWGEDDDAPITNDTFKA